MAESSVFKPIRNGTVSKIVMERIKEALINRELKPGDRLPTESELCSSMGVGKSSVREAIKMLEVLGVVESRQGDGTFIAASIPENSVNPLVYQLLIDYGSNADILELRSMFEPAYTLLAMRNANEDDLREIRRVSEEFRRKVEAGTQQADDDLEFHLAVLHATHNPFVIRLGVTVMQLFRASIGVSMRQIPERAVADHKRILDAFLAGNEAALSEAIQSSFEGWKAMMEERTRETEACAQ